MENRILKHKQVSSKKERYDWCADHLDWGLFEKIDGKMIVDQKEAKNIGLTEEDVSTLQMLSDRNWRIPVGEKHWYQTGVYEGDFYAIRMSVKGYDILSKYELFNED